MREANNLIRASFTSKCRWWGDYTLHPQLSLLPVPYPSLTWRITVLWSWMRRSADTISLKMKRFSGLLLLDFWTRRYCKLEGCKILSVFCLSAAASSITKGWPLSLLARTDVLVAPNMEDWDFKQVNKSALEVVSSLDWWLVTLWGLVNCTNPVTWPRLIAC